MQTRDYSDLPGAGMSYTDLCNTGENSPERLFWCSLDAFATSLGAQTIAGGLGLRSKTVDEMIPEVLELLPAGTDLRAAVEATTHLLDYFSRYQHKTTYEIRILRTNGGQPRWDTVRTADTEDEATDMMAGLEGTHRGALYITVRVETSTQTTIA